MEPYLRHGPHAAHLVPGCGIGTTVNCFAAALKSPGWTWTRWPSSPASAAPGRVAGYMKLDTFHTTHGRAIPFATGSSSANPS